MNLADTVQGQTFGRGLVGSRCSVWVRHHRAEAPFSGRIYGKATQWTVEMDMICNTLWISVNLGGTTLNLQFQCQKNLPHLTSVHSHIATSSCFAFLCVGPSGETTIFWCQKMMIRHQRTGYSGFLAKPHVQRISISHDISMAGDPWTRSLESRLLATEDSPKIHRSSRLFFCA